MKKLIPFFLLFLLTITLSFLGNCGGKETYEGYIRAQVKIVTPTYEDSFSFGEPCNLLSDEIEKETYWQISAADLSVPFGIIISWKESFITDPGNYQVDKSSLNLHMYLMRAHPTMPGWFRYSGVDEGNVTFTQVGYQSGDLIEGTFDQLLLDSDTSDETIYIEVNEGAFRCWVE